MTIAEKILGVDYISFDFKKRLERRKDIPRDLEVCKRNLLDVKEVLDENGIVFWLFYGTLLGAIRDGDFIKHDTDTDLGFYFESKENFHLIVEKLIEKGFELYRTTCNDNLVSVIRDDEYIDCAFFRSENLPFTQLRFIEFLGTEFRIPGNPEELFNDWYGEWREPVENKHATMIYGLDL
jgi:lipopolysaccharide cholinephosphotransferase